MDAQELIKRIKQERDEWVNAAKYKDSGREVYWVMHGFDIARRVIDNFAEEERKRRELLAPRLHKWMAGDLFRAVKQSLNLLDRGERGRAIKILRGVHDKVIAHRDQTDLENPQNSQTSTEYNANSGGRKAFL